MAGHANMTVSVNIRSIQLQAIEQVIEFSMQENMDGPTTRRFMREALEKIKMTSAETIGDSDDAFAKPVYPPSEISADGKEIFPGDPRFGVRVRTIYGSLKEQIVEANSLVEALEKAIEIPLTEWFVSEVDSI